VLFIDFDPTSVRIKPKIKEYFQIRKINFRDIIEEKYKELRVNELPELLEERKQLIIRLEEIEKLIPKLENDAKDNIDIIDGELFQWYKSQRSIDDPTPQDLDALKYQLEKKQIDDWTPKKVIEHWKNKGGG
jgi:hypothetical protein